MIEDYSHRIPSFNKSHRFQKTRKMLSRLDTLELVSPPIIQIPLQRAKSLSTRHLMGYSPQQFLDERCQACQVLTFTSPEANLPWQHMGENAGGESHHSITGPWTPGHLVYSMKISRGSRMKT
ncbi:hypothetical protein UPYG_G00347630 [Umbra pygmaea]|uniref:Uncharacterized protein n=1 Tax=Umbra pygmaea TaxID=75934 RepID=A0ABD0WFD4_UMBPY